jgi:isoquinoline 1-oxidoreductase
MEMNEGEHINYGPNRASFFGPVSRRQFLQSVGGGVLILFAVGDVRNASGQEDEEDEKQDFNAYLRIGADGTVSCFTGKIEMGQGAMTSLAQMLADELDVSLESVDMVMGDTALCPFDAGTWGSMSTPYLGPALRAAGAEARAVLLELAAEHLDVPKDRLVAKDGTVFDKTQDTRRVTYAELTKGKLIERHIAEEPDLKDPSEFNLIGKPTKRIDSQDKVTGKALYAGDIRVPGMLYAKVLRPPAHGARLKSVDTSAADKREGVQVVRDGDLVAVLHKYPDEAEKALAQVKPEFDIPEPRVDDKTIFDYFLDNAEEGEIEDGDGDVATGEKLADTLVEATYLNSYVAHAPIETHTALAQFEGDQLTVWASTQTPFGLRRQVARAVRMPVENVRVIAPFLGGGFGGKIADGQAVQAARIAKIAKKPVQVAWTRAEEFFYDTFRPAAVVRIKSGIVDSGKMVLWDYGVYGAGGRGAELFYAVPHYRTVMHWELEDAHPFATGPWRAPDNNTNSFARESHIDTTAAKAGMDPLEFRLKNLTDDRMKRVLRAAADKFGWTPSRTPSGRGFGIACGSDVDAYVALMAEVEVDEATGKVQVKRVVCAQDLGLVVNPEGAKLQVEGCVTMGLGYALTEEVRFEGGQILDLNFNTYNLPRFSWVPKIETVLLELDGRARGGGEPAIVCMGGVVANAVHDATGARVLQLPMTRERVKAAIAARATAPTA